MIAVRYIRKITPGELAKTIVLGILVPFTLGVLHLTVLGVILGMNPTPVVASFLIDGSYAAAPIMASCLLFWLAYLPVHAMIVYPRSTQSLTALRDMWIHPVAAPCWFPIPTYTTEKWRFLISEVRLTWSRLKRTAENTDGALSTVWSAGVHPQLE